MLIKLVPSTSEPTVLFSFDFPHLPPNLQIPPAWANQIAVLNLDDLELPSVLHALDKSASITALLQEVTFDMPTLTISCVFVDGAQEEWPLMGPGCIEALETVIRDVNESAAEADRESEREVARERWREYERERLLTTAMPLPVTHKPGRHKKQRSLLMSLVACVPFSFFFFFFLYPFIYVPSSSGPWFLLFAHRPRRHLFTLLCLHPRHLRIYQLLLSANRPVPPSSTPIAVMSSPNLLAAPYPAVTIPGLCRVCFGVFQNA